MSEYVWTEDDLMLLDIAEDYIAKTESFPNKMYQAFYKGVGQPLSENRIYKKVERLAFHTTAGRTSLFIMKRIDANFETTLNYLLAYRLNRSIDETIELYSPTISAYLSTTLFVFLLDIGVGVVNALFNELVFEKAGDLNQLYEETEEEKELLKRR